MERRAFVYNTPNVVNVIIKKEGVPAKYSEVLKALKKSIFCLPVNLVFDVFGRYMCETCEFDPKHIFSGSADLCGSNEPKITENEFVVKDYQPFKVEHLQVSQICRGAIFEVSNILQKVAVFLPWTRSTSENFMSKSRGV